METQVMQVTQHKTGLISVSVAEENIIFVGSQCGTCFMSTFWHLEFPKIWLTPPRTGLTYKRMLVAVLVRAGRRPVWVGHREFLFEAQYHGSCWAHEGTVRDVTPLVNLSASCMLYIGQSYRYSPENAFYIFSPQIYLMIFFRLSAQSPFIPPQNAVYFIMLPFLVNKMFTFYINDVLHCQWINIRAYCSDGRTEWEDKEGNSLLGCKTTWLHER
jgi:hypothetical protein